MARTLDLIVVDVTNPRWVASAKHNASVMGRRACPPEDCGGIWGCADLLAVAAGSASPEHDDWLVWLGGPIDPEASDLEAVNPQLARMR